MENESPVDSSHVFDSFDIDLVVKVLAHTLFGPFFVFFVPVFFIFQGAKLHDPQVVTAIVYWIFICCFWFVKWYSRLYRNQGSLLFGPPPLDWGEQIVLITGGASGIGELVANTLAVRSVTVVVLDIKPIVTENYNITYYQCDVSKWEEVEAVSKKVIEEVHWTSHSVDQQRGRVQGKRILDLSKEDLLQTFGVNTLAHYWTLKAFLPNMIANKTGHIVTVGSISGLIGIARMMDYTASKAALVSLHESLRYELDKCYDAPGVRTTLLLPGHILTPLFSTVRLPSSWLYKFFVPSVAPVDVAKKVIAALDEQHSQTIYLPFYANFVPYLKIVPSFIRDFAQWLSYADHGMEEFVKVSGRRPDEGALPEASQRSKAD